MLARWLPAAINTRPAEWSRAAIGIHASELHARRRSIGEVLSSRV